MNQESAADRQAAQQAREQEKRHHDDSAVAVSPDTQRADPAEAVEPPDAGESSRGQSAVFDEPADTESASAADAGEGSGSD